jgi:hypothetical protein
MASSRGLKGFALAGIAKGLMRRPKPKRPIRPTTNYQKAIKYGRQFTQVAANASRRMRRNVLFREKSEQQQDADLQQGQAEANMRRERIARSRVRNELNKRYAPELEKITAELQKIIQMIKKEVGIKGRMAIEHPLIMERLTINLFENLDRKVDFVTAQEEANKTAMGDMMLSIEKTMMKYKISGNKMTPRKAETIEGIINQNIQQVFEERQQQG